MPLYEYRCSKCGNVFEVLQKFSDAPLKKHQGCGGKVEKLISASGFQLKGSGWYATDYAAKGSSGSAKETKSESSEGKSDGKSDAKATETKSDSAKSESKSESKSDSKPAATASKKD
jgi:putative FmdB family regulatory protein